MSYIEQVGDQMAPQGCRYDTTRNTIAGNEDSPAKTIEDLEDYGDEHDSTFVGIKPGAELKKAVKDWLKDNSDFADKLRKGELTK